MLIENGWQRLDLTEDYFVDVWECGNGEFAISDSETTKYYKNHVALIEALIALGTTPIKVENF